MMFGTAEATNDTTTTGTCQCIAAPCNCDEHTTTDVIATSLPPTPAPTTTDELKAWFEANKTLAIGGGIAILALVFLSRR